MVLFEVDPGDKCMESCAKQPAGSTRVHALGLVALDSQVQQGSQLNAGEAMHPGRHFYFLRATLLCRQLQPLPHPPQHFHLHPHCA